MYNYANLHFRLTFFCFKKMNGCGFDTYMEFLKFLKQNLALIVWPRYYILYESKRKTVHIRKMSETVFYF